MNPKVISYSEKIDRGLDYSNTEEMISLFQEAKLLSTESVYRFLEELSGAPIWKNKSKRLLNNLIVVLNYIYTNFHHPLKEIAFEAPKFRLDRKYLPIKKVLILMTKIRKYPNCYAILNIVYFSSRRNGNINIVENLYDTIIQEWKETK